MVKAKKTRFRAIRSSPLAWLVEYLPEGKWDLPWNWKPYCRTLTKAAAKRTAEDLLNDSGRE